MAWKSAFPSTLWGELVFSFAPLNGSERKPNEGITDVSLSMKLLVCPVVQPKIMFLLCLKEWSVQTFLRDLKFIGKCFVNGFIRLRFKDNFCPQKHYFMM